MNVKTKTALSIIIPLLLLGGMILVYFLRNSSGDVKNAQPQYKISSKELNREFILNDSITNLKYSGKIVELQGIIADVKKSEAHGIIIVFDDPSMGVKCVMDSTIKEIPKDAEIGNTVKIKGVCIGSDQLIGVMINQCIITEKSGTNL